MNNVRKLITLLNLHIAGAVILLGLPGARMARCRLGSIR
jgi:hypothetical protein